MSAPEATPRQLGAWALYDWANSPFFAVILTFVFATYFTQGVAENEIDGTAQWGIALSLSGITIAVLSPVLGAIADIGGRRKPWLLAFTVAAALATSLLWLIEPDPSFIVMALVLVFIANTSLEFGQAFYNSMLARPRLAQDARKVVRARLVARLRRRHRRPGPALFRHHQPGPAALRPRCSDGRAGPPRRPRRRRLAAGVRPAALPHHPRPAPRRGAHRAPAAREGLGNLWRTLRSLSPKSQVLRFLIARLVYNDGLNTLFTFGGIYAAGTFGMTTAEIMLFAIALNISAGIGSFAFGYIDDRLGSKQTVLLAVAGLTLFGIIALLAQDKQTFFALGVLIGLFVGPAQSASRTLMARLAPPAQRTEMFGLYALSGKVTAFIGPLLFGAATVAFDTQRAGMAVVVVMLAAGGLLLLVWVREPAHES